MTLRSRLIGTQQLQPGDTVGYGNSFTTDRPMCIGVMACGDADDYRRLYPAGTPVLVDGARCRTVCRVSIDMLTVDLTPVPATGIGSTVMLCGRSTTWPQDGAVLAIDEVAAAGTIGYEPMHTLARRVPDSVT